MVEAPPGDNPSLLPGCFPRLLLRMQDITRGIVNNGAAWILYW